MLQSWVHCCRRVNDVEAKYYADGEDAFDMRKGLNPKPQPGSQKAEQQQKQQQQVGLAFYVVPRKMSKRSEVLQCCSPAACYDGC